MDSVESVGGRQSSSSETGASLSVWHWMLLAVFIAVPIANFAVPFLPGGDEQFSDYGSTRVDAAPYAFSIWFLIFVGMIGFAVRLVSGAESDTRALRAGSKSLLVAGLSSIAFVPISLYASDTLTFVDILAHLVALSAAVFYLRKHAGLVSKFSRGRFWFFAPSMYLGWISAATVISAALMLKELGVQVPAEIATMAACITLGAVTVIALLMLRERDIVYSATLVWALVAVGIQQSGYPPVRWTAWISAFLLLVAILIRFTNPPSFYAVQSGKSLAD